MKIILALFTAMEFLLRILLFGAIGYFLAWAFLLFPTLDSFDLMLLVVWALMVSVGVRFGWDRSSIEDSTDAISEIAGACIYLLRHQHKDLVFLICGFFVLGTILRPLMPNRVFQFLSTFKSDQTPS